MGNALARAMAQDPAVRRAAALLTGDGSADGVSKALVSKFGFSGMSGGGGGESRVAAQPQAKPQAVAKPASNPKKPNTLQRKQRGKAPDQPVNPIKPAGVGKADESDEVTVYTEISKTDPKKQLVFGWASIVSKDGLPVSDRQGDYISPDDLEDSAYTYVLESRKGGHQHKRTPLNEPMHVSDMVESVMLTPEKIQKMGLPPETPQGWWVGYKVRDPEVWDAVEKGEITGFSVHGKGKRTPLSKAEAANLGLM